MQSVLTPAKFSLSVPDPFSAPVERNALRAGLVDRAEGWRWGSLARAVAGPSAVPGPPLSPWPVTRPADWTSRVNAPLTPAEEEAVRRSVRRGQPFGSPPWQSATASRLGLESAFRPLGRPKRENNGS